MDEGVLGGHSPLRSSPGRSHGLLCFHSYETASTELAALLILLHFSHFSHYYAKPLIALIIMSVDLTGTKLTADHLILVSKEPPLITCFGLTGMDMHRINHSCVSRTSLPVETSKASSELLSARRSTYSRTLKKPQMPVSPEAKMRTRRCRRWTA